MYDIGTQTVSKLSGELSSAFVDAAETNSKQAAPLAGASSNVVETRVPSPTQDHIYVEEEADLVDAATDFDETKIPVIDPTKDDNLSEASEQLESFVDVSGMPINPQEDLSVAASSYKGAKSFLPEASGNIKTGTNL